jgi:hypothetical protein
MTVEITGVPAFDAAAAQSEQLLQQDVASARLNDGVRPPPTPTAMLPLQTDLNAAHVRHYRRLAQAAIANGMTPNNFTAALRSLGAGLYA